MGFYFVYWGCLLDFVPEECSHNYLQVSQWNLYCIHICSLECLTCLSLPM